MLSRVCRLICLSVLAVFMLFSVAEAQTRVRPKAPRLQRARPPTLRPMVPLVRINMTRLQPRLTSLTTIVAGKGELQAGADGGFRTRDDDPPAPPPDDGDDRPPPTDRGGDDPPPDDPPPDDGDDPPPDDGDDPPQDDPPPDDGDDPPPDDGDDPPQDDPPPDDGDDPPPDDDRPPPTDRGGEEPPPTDRGGDDAAADGESSDDAGDDSTDDGAAVPNVLRTTAEQLRQALAAASLGTAENGTFGTAAQAEVGAVLTRSAWGGVGDAMQPALLSLGNDGVKDEVRTLLKHADGLLLEPHRVRNAVIAFNGFVKASSGEFLANPPEEFQILYSTLAALTDAAYEELAAVSEASTSTP